VGECHSIRSLTPRDRSGSLSSPTTLVERHVGNSQPDPFKSGSSMRGSIKHSKEGGDSMKGSESKECNDFIRTEVLKDGGYSETSQVPMQQSNSILRSSVKHCIKSSPVSSAAEDEGSTVTRSAPLYAEDPPCPAVLAPLTQTATVKRRYLKRKSSVPKERERKRGVEPNYDEFDASLIKQAKRAKLLWNRAHAQQEQPAASPFTRYHVQQPLATQFTNNPAQQQPLATQFTSNYAQQPLAGPFTRDQGQQQQGASPFTRDHIQQQPASGPFTRDHIQQPLAGPFSRDYAQQQSFAGPFSRDYAHQQPLAGPFTRDYVQQQQGAGPISRDLAQQQSFAGPCSRDYVHQQPLAGSYTRDHIQQPSAGPFTRDYAQQFVASPVSRPFIYPIASLIEPITSQHKYTETMYSMPPPSLPSLDSISSFLQVQAATMSRLEPQTSGQIQPCSGHPPHQSPVMNAPPRCMFQQSVNSFHDQMLPDDQLNTSRVLERVGRVTQPRPITTLRLMRPRWPAQLVESPCKAVETSASSSNRFILPGMGPYRDGQREAGPYKFVQPGFVSYRSAQPGVGTYRLVQHGIGSYRLIQPGVSPYQVVQPGVSPYQVIQRRVNPHEVANSAVSPHEIVQPGISPHEIVQPGMNLIQVVEKGGTSSSSCSEEVFESQNLFNIVDQGPSQVGLVDQGPSQVVDQVPSQAVDQGPSQAVDQGTSEVVDQGPSQVVVIEPANMKSENMCGQLEQSKRTGVEGGEFEQHGKSGAGAGELEEQRMMRGTGGDELVVHPSLLLSCEGDNEQSALHQENSGGGSSQDMVMYSLQNNALVYYYLGYY